MSRGYTARHSNLGERSHYVLRKLLERPLEETLASPGACLNQVRGVYDAYRAIDRPNLDAAQLIEMKFACLHWRRQLIDRLGTASSSWVRPDHTTLIGIVEALNSRLPDSANASLSQYLDAQQADRLLACQGLPGRGPAPHGALAGPGIELAIQANRSSRWPFERWKRNPRFGAYEFAGDGVNFRGLHLRPGDILLANVNIDGNGVYTALSDPARFCSHAAVFAILEDGDRRYPAVMETYEHGVRAVPLNVFVGGKFCAYLEVYRHRDLDKPVTDRINRAALDIMERAYGYNFDSIANDRDYVSCCSVGRLLHEDAGLEPASWKSSLGQPKVQANLRTLGFSYVDVFAPVDYLLDPKFECAGWLDNHQFDDLLARELVEMQFRKLFMSRDLDPARLPLMGRVNRWGIRHIRARTLLGKAIGLVEGFDHRSLPKGPDPLLAVITIVEAQLSRAVGRTRRWLRGIELAPGYFSLDEFQRRAQVKAHLEQNLRLPWLRDA